MESLNPDYDSIEFAPIRRNIKLHNIRVIADDPPKLGEGIHDRYITITRPTKSTIKKFGTLCINNRMRYGSHHCGGCYMCHTSKKRICQDKTNFMRQFNKDIKDD
jgi:hypothetical protein